jgi:RES domain-containing protein
MMVYRIGRTKYADDLTGNGAKVNGGRWNYIGTPCIYTAESRALCALEFTAHNSLEDVRRALSITRYQVPEHSIFVCAIPTLPGNWREWPHPGQTRDFGTTLLNKAEYLVIQIPSVVIPQEFNYLLNPAHKDFHMIDKSKITIEDFIYDVRLKS